MVIMKILLRYSEQCPKRIVQHLDKRQSGKTSKDSAKYALDFVLKHLPHADRISQSILLLEVTILCSMYPILFSDTMMTCVRQKDALSSQQNFVTSEMSMDVGKQISGGVTIVNLNNIVNTNKPVTKVTSGVTPDPVTSKTIGYVSGVPASIDITACPKDMTRNDGTMSNINNTHITSITRLRNIQTSGEIMSTEGSTTTSTHTGCTRHVKLSDFRSTGRLYPASNMHHSITRLDMTGGLHKSMTRLSSSQNSSNTNTSTSNNHTSNINSISTPISTTISSGNFIVQAISTIVVGCTSKITDTFNSTRYVTPVPPLSNNVIITGHNKWGIPSTQVTSGGVTVNTSSIKASPNSQGLIAQVNSKSEINHYKSSLVISPNAILVKHASPASPQQHLKSGNHRSIMKLPSVNEVIVSGPTTNVRISQDNKSRILLNANNSLLDQRMSTFEPYHIMRDPVQQFCEKHFNSIKAYMDEVSRFLPPPTRCSIEVSNEFSGRRTKKVAKLHFACQIRGPHCLYSKTCFTIRTRNPKTWIHLLFLDFQVRHYAKEKCVLSTREPGISNLKNIWQILKCENRSFTELVTSQFPNSKEREILLNELRHSGFLDVFEASKTLEVNQFCNELEYQWGCFLCNHPDKAEGFLNSTNQPMIEGQLKEKKGKWRLFQRWRTRYFTLSGAHLSCKGSSGGESIDVNQIRSVKVSRGARNIPKAFEIFTSDQTLILKPKNGKNAEEWVQCLSIVVAHSQSRDNPIGKSNSLPARGNTTSKHSLFT